MDPLKHYSDAKAYLQHEYDADVFRMGPYLECAGITYYLHYNRLWRLTPSYANDTVTPLIISLEKRFV